jgi:GTP-binding protein LepA
MNIMVAEKPVAVFAIFIHTEEAQRRGKDIVEALKDTLPRQQFVIKIQAAIGAKVIASERIQAFRKDVTGYLYGGDVTRKMKLLEKQKKGKKKMMAMGAGSVDIPQEAFIRVLRRETRN